MLSVFFSKSDDLLIYGLSTNGCSNLCIGSISSWETLMVWLGYIKTHKCPYQITRQKPVTNTSSTPIGYSASRHRNRLATKSAVLWSHFERLYIVSNPSRCAKFNPSNYSPLKLRANAAYSTQSQLLVHRLYLRLFHNLRASAYSPPHRQAWTEEYMDINAVQHRLRL
jgi:hypothetical protein